MELFDISKPEDLKSIGFTRQLTSFKGMHCLWFRMVRQYTVLVEHLILPKHPDDQFYQILDVRNPSKINEIGRWWMPGSKIGDIEELPPRVNPEGGVDPMGSDAFRVHNVNVYDERPDRAYVGYIDGGVFILDIKDKSNPKVVSNWNPHNPYPGFSHTALPLFDRELIIVTDECIKDDGADWPKLTWILDARNEKNLVPISTLPLPPVEEFGIKGDVLVLITYTKTDQVLLSKVKKF